MIRWGGGLVKGKLRKGLKADRSTRKKGLREERIQGPGYESLHFGRGGGLGVWQKELLKATLCKIFSKDWTICKKESGETQTTKEEKRDCYVKKGGEDLNVAIFFAFFMERTRRPPSTTAPGAVSGGRPLEISGRTPRLWIETVVRRAGIIRRLVITSNADGYKRSRKGNASCCATGSTSSMGTHVSLKRRKKNNSIKATGSREYQKKQPQTTTKPNWLKRPAMHSRRQKRKVRTRHGASPETPPWTG